MRARLSDLLLCSQSDERLVSLARIGNERAFAAIVKRYRRELYALACRLGSDGRAEDLVQQTFLSAFSAVQSGTEVEHLRGWLYQILRNAASRASSHSETELGFEAANIAGEPLEDAVEHRILAGDVLYEIAALPAMQRYALLASAVQGHSRAEVAGSMGLSEGAVRQLIYRARAALRSAITAITPCPLARWLAAAGNAPGAERVPEIAAGAGAASLGGVALKLGTLAASGVIATAIVPVTFNAHRARRSVIAQRPAHAIASDGRLRAPTDRGSVTSLSARVEARHRSPASRPSAGQPPPAVIYRSGREGSNPRSPGRSTTTGGRGSSDGTGREDGRGGTPAAGAASSTDDGGHDGTGTPAAGAATLPSNSGSDGQLPASTASSGSSGNSGASGDTGSSGDTRSSGS